MSFCAWTNPHVHMQVVVQLWALQIYDVYECVMRLVQRRSTLVQHPEIAMASPVFRQAFSVFDNKVPIDKAVSQTVVKIIHLDHLTDPFHKNQSWYQALEADGVNISYLQNPCRLTSLEGHSDKTLAEVELRHTFTERFWGFSVKEPVAGAIAVSHLRALHEAISMSSAELIIVLEGDVQETDNTPQLFASLLANWFNNPELRYTKCISLSYSNWHGCYDQLIREHHKVIKGSRVPPYFQLIEMPWKANDKGQKSFKFVGQRARALADSRDFAKDILSRRVNHFYDMWIIEELTKERREFDQQNWKGKFTTPFICAASLPSSSMSPTLTRDSVVRAGWQPVPSTQPPKTVITSASL